MKSRPSNNIKNYKAMPEFAETYFQGQRWKKILHHKIDHVHFSTKLASLTPLNLPNDFKGLQNAELSHWEHHGKWNHFYNHDFSLFIHLGMTGSIQIENQKNKELKHKHLSLKTAEEHYFYCDPRRFGKIVLCSKSLNLDFKDQWTKQAPTPLCKDFSWSYFFSVTKKFQKTPIKNFLLNQDWLKGVGNWMADEILWRSLIHPLKKLQSLKEEELKIIYEEIITVSTLAMELIGKKGKDPDESWLFQHRWKNDGICPVSGSPLMKIKINTRSACFSPELQKI